jgi:hypothetical protein
MILRSVISAQHYSALLATHWHADNMTYCSCCVYFIDACRQCKQLVVQYLMILLCISSRGGPLLLPPYCPGTSKLYCVLSKSASHSEKASSRGVALSALLLRASAHFCVSLCSSFSALCVAFALTGVVNHLLGKNFSNSRTCSEAYLRL